MANLPDAMESTVVAYIAQGTTPPALTAPMQVQLLSALGTDDAAGTPIEGAVLDFGATGSGDTRSNAAVLRFEGLANPTTVAGFRVQDSSGTVTQDNIARTGGAVSVTDGIFEIPAEGLSITAA